jgi:UDP-2-acetamido-2-deoxy-ribo-hexuluronate aminotransferase
MQKIKMVDLHGQYLKIKSDIDKAIQVVLDSTAFIQGPQVGDFASALATYCHSDHAIACGNGTDALQIAMMGLELKPGDEVILPVFTYVATAEVVSLLNLRPVFIDVDERTFNLDVSLLEERISSRTRAIVPVHLFGQCADMEPILSLARKKNIFVIEDAAQALGAAYRFSDGSVTGAGAMGQIGCTSFFPSKNLGCYGDGGAMFTQDGDLATKLKMIANHGQQKKYYHDLIGVNSRLDTLQAAILKVKLEHLDDYTLKRQEIAANYNDAFAGLDLLTPNRTKSSTHVYNQYTIKVDEGKRDELKIFLERSGVPSMIYYPVPLHLQRAYRGPRYPEGSFPVAEKLSKMVLSLPIHTEITKEQQDYICSMVKAFFN